jgi:hypothetical protein
MCTNLGIIVLMMATRVQNAFVSDMCMSRYLGKGKTFEKVKEGGDEMVMLEG